MGVRNFSLNWVPRTGYMFVDVMLLISGFCLFLPYARQVTDPLAPEPDNLRTFFKKRAARILPSYYLCLLLYLIFWVRPSDYANVNQYLQDIFAHLTFTQTFWPESYIGTKFPTALWTLGVEMQFYLVFPLLARVFRRFPLACWAVLSVLAQVYIVLFAAARQRRKPAHQPASGVFGCICKRYAVCALLLPPADMARARMEEKPYFTACGADAASVQRCCHCVYVK